MTEKLLPISRTNATWRAVGGGVFVLAGCAMVIWGIATAASFGPSVVVGGALLAAVFGLPTLASIQSLRTGGLLLTEHGYEYNGSKIAWSDIAGFTLPEGEAGVTHIKVQFVEDVRLTGWAFVSKWLGSVGLYIPPTVIPIGTFVTDSPLDSVLRQWWLRYRKG